MVRARLAFAVLSVGLADCGLFVGLEDKSLLVPDDGGSTLAEASVDDRGGDGNTSTSPPQTILSGLAKPSSVAVDVNNVYVSEESGTVKRLRKGDARPVTMAKGQALPTQLLVDTQFVYWRNTNAAKKAPEQFFDSIVRLEKDKDDGTIPQRILSEESARPSEVRGIALYEGGGDNLVYFTRDDKVRRKPRNDGQDIELVNNLKIPRAIVADDKFVYFATDGDFTIRRHTKSNVGADGGPNPPAETMFTSADSRVVIAMGVDDQSLYFMTEAGILSKMDKTPGSVPKPLAISGPTGTAYLALDERNVYWTNGARGTLTVVAKDGSDETKKALVSDRMDIGALAIDLLDAPRRAYFLTPTELQRVDLP